MQLHKNITLLKWFNFFTDFKLFAPIAILYFAQITGSYAYGMMIFSIAMISSAIFEIPTGIFSDRIGRRKTIILGAISALASIIFYAIGQSFWILIIGALFEGLSRSLYSGNNDALLHDTRTQMGKESDYSEHLGKTGAMFQAALAISAVMGGFIAIWSFPMIMWLSVIPQLACVILSFQFIEPRVHSKNRSNVFTHIKEAYLNFKHNRRLRLLSLSSIISYGVGEASYQFQAAFYSMLWPVWAIGLAKTLANLSATISFHFSGKVIKRYGEIKSLVYSSLYQRVVNILAALFPTLLSPLLISSTSLFFGVAVVSRNTLFQKEFKNEQRATTGSLNSFAGNIFLGFVSILLGYTADKMTPAHALLIFQLLMLPVIYLNWKIYRRK